MNILAMLVLGLLIGWLIEWAIDWFYWRRRHQPIVEENDSLKERIATLETKKKRRASKSKPIQNRQGQDNLQAIRGVGPVISKRLNEAGIYTFEEMAELTPEELQEILGELIKRFFPGEDKMIAQAKEFAAQKAAKG
ncbi:MAG TPA: helix-hairpin-helix domain-containing protein [Anaerolineales bacterium]|nr:helix-hairpin-helix domain-containing protein [Anaerolineales bacterium]